MLYKRFFNSKNVCFHTLNKIKIFSQAILELTVFNQSCGPERIRIKQTSDCKLTGSPFDPLIAPFPNLTPTSRRILAQNLRHLHCLSSNFYQTLRATENS